MKWLRVFVFLRRIARAVERQADYMERMAMVWEGWWAKESKVRSKQKTETEFGVLDMTEVEKRWAEEHQL